MEEKNVKYYLVMDFRKGVLFDDLFYTYEDALGFAEYEWKGKFTEKDKRDRDEYYILETEDLDTYDGDILKRFK